MADAAPAPATDAAPPSEPAPETPEASDAKLGEAGEKALADFKSRARTAEKALKAAQAELDKVRTESMSEQEKAVTEAKNAGRTEALQEAGIRLVDAEIRVAGHGRTFDTDALLALDRKTFLTDDGETDTDAIKEWVEEHSQSADETTDKTQQKGPLSDLDLGQGSNQHVAIGDDAALQKMLTDLVNK